MVGSVNDLQQAILNTLKQWHDDAPSSMGSLFLVRQIVAERGPLYGNTPANVARELLEAELDVLQQGSEEEKSAVRFIKRVHFDGMMMKEYAYESGLSRFALNRRRENAIQRMAETLWARELAARDTHRAKLLKFVPRPTYKTLIGRSAQKPTSPTDSPKQKMRQTYSFLSVWAASVKHRSSLPSATSLVSRWILNISFGSLRPQTLSNRVPPSIFILRRCKRLIGS